jgi:pimeloyl-ACP methyl ester carboxylesterase
VKISFVLLVRTRHLIAFMCAVFSLLTLSLICGCQVCFAQTDTPPNAPVPPGRLIDLGGYKLHLNCTGQGSPVVVLLAGGGDFSFDWDLVQPQVAKFTRVCSYDRAGEAWSDLGPRPRTIMNGKLVRVRMLSKGRQIPAPRTSITTADALSPKEKERIEAMIKQFKIRPEIEAPFDRLPAVVQSERIWALSQLKHFAATADDYLPEETAKIYAETRAATFPLRNLPLIVLSRSKDDYPPGAAEEMSKEHRDEQESLSELSRRGKLIVVPNSGHHIQLDAPNAVIGAVETEVSASHN